MKKSNGIRRRCTMLAMIVLAILSVAGHAYAVPERPGSIADSSLYNELSILDSETLLKESTLNIQSDTLLDRSVVALSIVANRYYDNPQDAKSRKDAAVAFYNLGSFYQLRGQDFIKSYKNLMSAQLISDEDGDHSMLAKVYRALANLYHNSDLNSKMSASTRKYLLQAFNEAKRAGDLGAMSSAIYSMATSAFNENELGEDFGEAVRQYFESVPPNETDRLGHILKTARACESYLKKDYANTEKLLLNVLDNLDDENDSQSVARLNTNLLLALVYKKEGRLDDVGNIYKRSLAYAKGKEYLMYESNICEILADYYREAGLKDSADLYYGKFLLLKDSLERGHGFRSVVNLGLMSQIDEINEEVRQLSVKRQEEQRIKRIIVSALLVVVVVLVSLVWVYVNLRRNHRRLFQQNEENLNTSFRQKLLREQLEEENRQLAEELKALKIILKPVNDAASPNTGGANPQETIAAEAEEVVETGEVEEAEEDEKIDNELKSVYAKVIKVMEESDDIYSPGFSLNDLAKLAEISPRTVSKAINTFHNAGFHQLHNEYRIRKVTTMMHDPAYANFTIESIAEKAGFQSRSSFTHLFKRVTGLTPGAYIKLAKG